MLSRLTQAALVASLLLLGVVPAAADCRADLATTDKSFEATLQRLESVAKGTQAQKCAAYRSHVQVMIKGRDVFMRCMTGYAQRENVGQMNDSLEEFHELIKRKCAR
jgi:hypothetical protein